MKVFGQIFVAAVAAVTLACSGNNNPNAANTTAAGRTNGAMDQNGNRTDMGGRARATLTGCLLAGGDAGEYVLQLASAADTTSPGTASSAPTPAGDRASARTFRVVADNDSDLSKNLNKRVAINGYVESGKNSGTVGTSGTMGSPDRSAGASGSTSTANSGQDMARNNTGSAMQTLRAESVRKVADQCQPASNNRSSDRSHSGGLR